MNFPFLPCFAYVPLRILENEHVWPHQSSFDLCSGSPAWVWSCSPVARTESWSNQSLQLGYRSMLHGIIPACLWVLQSHCNCVWKQVLINLLIYTFKCKNKTEGSARCIVKGCWSHSYLLKHLIFTILKTKLMCSVEDVLTIVIFEIWGILMLFCSERYKKSYNFLFECRS